MPISSREIAVKFLNDQIRIMKKHGKAPKLTSTQRKKLITEVQASFESLRNGRDN